MEMNYDADKGSGSSDENEAHCHHHNHEPPESESEYDEGGVVRHGTCNILVMSQAGKPIFARFGSSNEVARLCALIQALRTSMAATANLGDIQSVQSGNLFVVFMHVQAITLVALSSSSNDNDGKPASSSSSSLSSTPAETMAYLHLILEYTYSHLLLTVTDQVQSYLQQHESYGDMTSIMGGASTEIAIRAMLQRLLEDDPGPFLTAGVETYPLLSPSIRDQASRTLQQVGDETPHTVFALLMNGTRLITLVQPSDRALRLHVSDLHLVAHFLSRQQHANRSAGGELWLPLCLPRFHSSGFLYSYTCRLDHNDPLDNMASYHQPPEVTRSAPLTLALLSQHGTTEQFQAFQAAAARIRLGLGVPEADTYVLEILPTMGTTPGHHPLTPTDVGRDIPWLRRKRTKNSGESSSDTHSSSGLSSSLDQNSTTGIGPDVEDDYVKLSQNGNRISSFGSSHDSSDPAIQSTLSRPPCPLLDEIRANHRDASAWQQYLNQCLELAGAIHFCFRWDAPVVPVRKMHRHRKPSPLGHLTQCLASHFIFPWSSSTSLQKQVWRMYQRLTLRLRLGSAGIEAVQDAFDMIAGNNGGNPTIEASAPTIGKSCPAMGLVETPPNVQGITYVRLGTETYLAMNGSDFELYITINSTIPVKQMAAMGARLARHILSDQDKLFLAKPPTWKDL